MRYTLILLPLLLSACSTTTHYEDCVENDLYKRYGTVEQCVAERKEARQRRAAAFSGFGNALQNTGNSSSNPTNCTSTKDFNGNVHTKCN